MGVAECPTFRVLPVMLRGKYLYFKLEALLGGELHPGQHGTGVAAKCNPASSPRKGLPQVEDGT